jgi:hypothetical protein
LPGFQKKTDRIFVALVALALLRCDSLYPPLNVRVQNSSGLPIEEARVTIKGAEIFIGPVPPSETRTGTLRPKKDSGMVLSFKDSNGRACRQNLDVYVDNGFGGDLDLLVLGCQSTTVKGVPNRPKRGF